MNLETEIVELLKGLGAVRVGFASLETLAGSPPSADLKYVLPEARSAVSFALQEDKEFLKRFLAKKDQLAHENDFVTTTHRSAEISEKVKIFLESKGYRSASTAGSGVYRRELPNWQVDMHADISHRYIAVASGVGSFGWSGNVGIQGFGTAILLGTVVTEADLAPTEPVPEGESFCSKCKRCAHSCVGRTFSAEEETSVTLGGKTFKFARRSNYNTCNFVAGGFTGLHESGEWSTWSPGRFGVSEDEKELVDSFQRAVKLSASWVKTDEGGFRNEVFPSGFLRTTCGVCALVCSGNKDETEDNYRTLTTSGCIVQDESGKKHVLPADEAAARFESFSPEHKSLYR